MREYKIVYREGKPAFIEAYLDKEFWQLLFLKRKVLSVDENGVEASIYRPMAKLPEDVLILQLANHYKLIVRQR